MRNRSLLKEPSSCMDLVSTRKCTTRIFTAHDIRCYQHGIKKWPQNNKITYILTLQMGQYSDWVTGLTTKRLEFDSRQRLYICVFCITSRPDLGPTQPPTYWVPTAVLHGAKRPGREHSPSLIAKKKMAELYLHQHARLHGKFISVLN
jgi:hypothetical protein